MQEGIQISNEVAYSCAELASMNLPNLPTSRQGWDKVVKAQRWSYVEVRSPGRGGISRKYHPPPAVMALIEAHLQGALTPTVEKAPAPKPQAPDQADNLAADPARSLYTYSVAPQPGGLEADPGTVSLVARCIVAAEKLLGDAYTREQQVTLAIDTWGALRRMFYGREAEHIAEIADADLELLTRFIYNTKRVLNPHAIKP